jgi:hypothetical protein
MNNEDLQKEIAAVKAEHVQLWKEIEALKDTLRVLSKKGKS